MGYLFSDPVEDDVREFLTGHINEAVEELGSGDDGDDADGEHGDSGVLEGPVLCNAQMHEELDAGGIHDCALHKVQT